MTGSIAVVGTGTIGTTLATAWRRAGLQVRLGSRRPDGRSTVAIETAVAGAHAVLLAVPVQALDELIPRIGPALDGRVVICPGNLVQVLAERHMVTGLGDGMTVGQAIQERLPASAVSRAFSHFAAELLATRARPPQAPVRWAVATAADTPAARDVTAHLIDLAGFDPYPLGSLAQSAALDPGGALWASLLTTGDIRSRLTRWPSA